MIPYGAPGLAGFYLPFAAAQQPARSPQLAFYSAWPAICRSPLPRVGRVPYYPDSRTQVLTLSNYPMAKPSHREEIDMAINTTLRASLRALILTGCVLTTAAPLTAQAGVGSWFHGEHIVGSGKIGKQSRDLPHFTGVAASVDGNVEVRIGNTESISI